MMKATLYLALIVAVVSVSVPTVAVTPGFAGSLASALLPGFSALREDAPANFTSPNGTIATGNPICGPCGEPTFVLGPAAEQAAPPDYFYNFTIFAAEPAMQVNESFVEIVDCYGSSISLGMFLNLTIVSSSEIQLGSYSFTTYSWSTSATLSFQPGMMLVLESSSLHNLAGQGNQLKIEGKGPAWVGEEYVAIP